MVGSGEATFTLPEVEKMLSDAGYRKSGSAKERRAYRLEFQHRYLPNENRAGTFVENPAWDGSPGYFRTTANKRGKRRA